MKIIYSHLLEQERNKYIHILEQDVYSHLLEQDIYENI